MRWEKLCRKTTADKKMQKDDVIVKTKKPEKIARCKSATTRVEDFCLPPIVDTQKRSYGPRMFGHKLKPIHVSAKDTMKRLLLLLFLDFNSRFNPVNNLNKFPVLQLLHVLLPVSSSVCILVRNNCRYVPCSQRRARNFPT